MFSLLGAVFLGWSLGANDAANCFGSAVASRMVRFCVAAVLAATFVVIGARLEGRAGIETLSGLTSIDLEQAVVVTVAAALTVTHMALAGLPVSTSQAAVGAILGIGIIRGARTIQRNTLYGILTGWFPTPPVAGFIAISIHYAIHLRYVPR